MDIFNHTLILLGFVFLPHQTLYHSGPTGLNQLVFAVYAVQHRYVNIQCAQNTMGFETNDQKGVWIDHSPLVRFLGHCHRLRQLTN
jgi:hypothetical protein